MSDDWLDSQQAAQILDCSPETVQGLLRDGLLAGKKMGGEWHVKRSEVECLQTKAKSPPPRAGPGMVEANVALAGLAAAIAAFLPGIRGMPDALKLIVATISSTVAFLAAYGGLWGLACSCLPAECPIAGSPFGLREVRTLFTNLGKIGPYAITAGGLLFLLVLSLCVGILAFL